MKVFFITLEQSAETIAQDLLEQILKEYPKAYLEGVFSTPLLNATQFLDSNLMKVMGLVDVIKSIPRILRVRKKIKNRILSENFDFVITIDSSSFNIPLVKSLKKQGCKAKFIHAVCPPIWAYRPKRKQTIVNTFDLLLPLFAFEEALFKDTSLKTFWIGHPLRKIAAINRTKKIKDTLCIFPGSRKAVIRRNLPLQISAAKKTGLKIIISVASKGVLDTIKKIAPEAELVEGVPSADVLENTAVAIATSGTITLELALLNIPTCVTYKISLIDAIAAKLANLQIKTFSLPNILAKKNLFPEHVHPFIQEKDLLDDLDEILKKPITSVEEKILEQIKPPEHKENLFLNFIHENLNQIH